jgi:hypothetical protein
MKEQAGYTGADPDQLHALVRIDVRHIRGDCGHEQYAIV